MHPQGQRSLFSALRLLRDSHEYSDLKIRCSGEEFTAHKAIVCTRSVFFKTACSWGQDGKTKDEIDLGDDEEPDMIRLMLNYLYLLDYSDASHIDAAQDVITDTSVQDAITAYLPEDEVVFRGVSPVNHDTWATSWSQPQQVPVQTQVEEDGWFGRPPMKKSQKKKGLRAPLTELRPDNADLRMQKFMVNAKMYVLADKYGIDDLKELAKKKFAVLAEDYWNTQDFVAASEYIFHTSPASDDELRDIVLQTLALHRELVKFPEWSGLLDSGNGLAWKLLKLIWA